MVGRAPTERDLEIAAELFPSHPPGFPFENFDVSSLTLPADDDMGVESEDDDLREEGIETESGFGSVIGAALASPRTASKPSSSDLRRSLLLPAAVVSNLPVIPQEKFDKLAAVIKKIYGTIGNIREGAQPRSLQSMVLRAPMQKIALTHAWPSSRRWLLHAPGRQQHDQGLRVHRVLLAPGADTGSPMHPLCVLCQTSPD